MNREKYFYEWLYSFKRKKNGKGMAESTIMKYTKAINTISDDMMEEKVIDKNLYNISSTLELNKIFNIILDNNVFSAKNSKGHNMYSVAFQHYIDFINDNNTELKLQ